MLENSTSCPAYFLAHDVAKFYCKYSNNFHLQTFSMQALASSRLWAESETPNAF